MKANPGGRLSLDEIVGRDPFVERLWSILDRQSVVLSAERRMGKSHVLWKMVEESASDERLIVYRDLEGTQTPLEFAEGVLRDVDAFLSRTGKVASRARSLLTSLGGVEIAGLFKLPADAAPNWKRLLTDTLADLAEHEARPVLFFWDELPLMIYNVGRQSGEAVAMELLDTLRQIRQTHRSVRMVFTGSIGLHNVLSALKAAGYANASINDMKIVEVLPIGADDAADLACRLLRGEQVQTTDDEAVGRALAGAVDNLPFYIHYVVDELKQRGGVADLDAVDATIHSCLTDPQDGWHMAHYRERLDTYYDAAQAALALVLLDVLAHDGPLTFDDLFDRARGRVELADGDAERVRSMLTLLQRDHYLTLGADGQYAFHFSLIRRWWALQRG